MKVNEDILRCMEEYKCVLRGMKVYEGVWKEY